MKRLAWATMTMLAPIAIAAVGSESGEPSCCAGELLALARCTGSASCRACKNCSSCAHCKNGGTCGVCAAGRSGSSDPEDSPRSGSGRDSKAEEGSKREEDRAKPIPIPGREVILVDPRDSKAWVPLIPPTPDHFVLYLDAVRSENPKKALAGLRSRKRLSSVPPRTRATIVAIPDPGKPDYIDKHWLDRPITVQLLGRNRPSWVPISFLRDAESKRGLGMPSSGQ